MLKPKYIISRAGIIQVQNFCNGDFSFEMQYNFDGQLNGKNVDKLIEDGFYNDVNWAKTKPADYIKVSKIR